MRFAPTNDPLQIERNKQYEREWQQQNATKLMDIYDPNLHGPTGEGRGRKPHGTDTDWNADVITMDYDPRSEEERWRDFQKDGRLSFADQGWLSDDEYIDTMSKKYGTNLDAKGPAPTEVGRSYTNTNASTPTTAPMVLPTIFAGDLPLTGLIGSSKGRRAGRLGRGNKGGETPVYGGGIGGGNVLISNIEANPVQTNLQTGSQLGPVATTAAGEDAVTNQTTTTTGTGVGTGANEAAGDESLMARLAPEKHEVSYRDNYSGDLTGQEAAGKATQLLRRAVGEQGIKSQGDFNKYFEPLYKDLQSGNDYGHDIGRFYENVRKEGRNPYQDWHGPMGKGATYDPVGGHMDPYSKFVTHTEGAAGGFHDKADYGRRMLEAKAYYRPGGTGTNLDRIGQIENRIGQREAEGFKFKGKDTPYAGGYRAGVTSYGDKQGGPWQEYYEKYLQGY